MARQTIKSWGIQSVYISRSILLAKNDTVFEGTSLSIRFTLERARIQALEFIHHLSTEVIAIAWGISGSSYVGSAARLVYISKKSLLSSFLKVNFNGTVLNDGNRGSMAFVI